MKKKKTVNVLYETTVCAMKFTTYRRRRWLFTILCKWSIIFNIRGSNNILCIPLPNNQFYNLLYTYMRMFQSNKHVGFF